MSDPVNYRHAPRRRGIRVPVFLGLALLTPLHHAGAQSVRSVTLSSGAITFLADTLALDGTALTPHRSAAYLADIDLDGDGRREHAVQLVTPLTCSNGAAVCAWVVYQGPPGRRAVLSTAAHNFRVLPEHTNGWRDLMFESRGRGGVIADTYAYDGTTYRLRESRTLTGTRP